MAAGGTAGRRSSMESQSLLQSWRRATSEVARREASSGASRRGWKRAVRRAAESEVIVVFTKSGGISRGPLPFPYNYLNCWLRLAALSCIFWRVPSAVPVSFLGVQSRWSPVATAPRKEIAKPEVATAIRQPPPLHLFEPAGASTLAHTLLALRADTRAIQDGRTSPS